MLEPKTRFRLDYKIFVIPRVELAMKSTNASSSSIIIKASQLTASTRIHPHVDSSKINATRAFITREENDLLVNEKNTYRQTHSHYMVTWVNAPKGILEFLLGHIPAHRVPTQPKNTIWQLSGDTTSPILENAHKRACNDHNTSINRLVEAMVGIASQQRLTTSAILKQLSTNTFFDGKNEEFELFQDLFHTKLKLQQYMKEAMKIDHFHAQLTKEATQTFRNNSATKKKNFWRRTHSISTELS